ncbi:WYL domain-containing transcriptional regulator [Hathewaya histolytica]|uniref:Putative transcriptional regulator n=1 Tax=Hathewaya histolytica TaxID=1498 RepID=A0A4U9QXK2_HATHI|nr:WYL domain-containing transcriptional regulator [Hathewaya histolytica]VTQ82233.1 putative transcriptional regulator [Hathewaya histolytica]
MSKFSNLLKMLLLLNGGKTMKAKELSEVLEVDERMIRKYKDDLSKAGFYVESIRGKDGGYFISETPKELFHSLTEHDIEVFNYARENLKSDDFMYYKDFELIVDKINNGIDKTLLRSNNLNYYIQEAKSSKSDTERKVSLKIHEAIMKRNKIKINYFSLNSGKYERVVSPYALFHYKSCVYFAGLCENSGEVKYFKLSRIEGNIEFLDEKYEIPKTFSLYKYLHNNVGIFNDREISIKLKVFKPMSYIISERIWSDNQKITWNEDESIIFEANIKGYKEIKAWLLSMGSSVKVLEPVELKQDIIREIQNIQINYEKSENN